MVSDTENDLNTYKKKNGNIYTGLQQALQGRKWNLLPNKRGEKLQQYDGNPDQRGNIYRYK